MSSAINTPIMPNSRRSLLRNEGMHQGKAPIVGLKSLCQAQADDMLSTAKGCTSSAPMKGSSVYKRCDEKRTTYLWPQGVLQKCQEGRREGLCVRHLCANKKLTCSQKRQGVRHQWSQCLFDCRVLQHSKVSTRHWERELG